MFGGELGIPELLLILGVALLLFGPKKIGQLGKSLGEGIRNFKGAINETKESVKTAVAVDEVKEAVSTNGIKEAISVSSDSLKTIQSVRKAMTAEGLKDMITTEILKK
jgi:sec-independent protein translocase protein TatA